MKVCVITEQGTCGDSWCFVEGVYATEEAAQAHIESIGHEIRGSWYRKRPPKAKIFIGGEFTINEYEVIE